MTTTTVSATTVALVLGGCAALPTGQMPATVPRGQARAHVGVHAFVPRGAPLVPAPSDLAADLGLRVGLADRIDAGGRLLLVGGPGGELGVKVQAARGVVDLAVAPALSYFPAVSDAPFNRPWAATLTVPLVAGWNVHPAVTVLLSPGVAISRTGAIERGGDFRTTPPAQIPGAGTRFVMVTGAAFRLDDTLWVAPELALARALDPAPDSAWTLAFGFSVFFGRCR